MAANVGLPMSSGVDDVHLTLTDAGFDVVRGGVVEPSIAVGAGQRLRTGSGQQQDSLTLDVGDRDVLVKVREGRIELIEGSQRMLLDGFGKIVVRADTDGPARVEVRGTDGVDGFTGSLAETEFRFDGSRTAATIGVGDVRVDMRGGDDTATLVNHDNLDDTIRLIPGESRIEGGGRVLKVKGVDAIDAIAVPDGDGGNIRIYGETDAANEAVVTEERVRLWGDDVRFTADNFRYTRLYSRHTGGDVDDTIRVYDQLWDETNGFTPDLDWVESRSKNTFSRQSQPTDSYFRQQDGANVTFKHLAYGFELGELMEVRRRDLAGEVNSSGAVAGNQQIPPSGEFYIEQQRYGYSLINAGLATDNAALIDEGRAVIDWGIAKQSAADGSFPGTEDALHSTTLFAHALGESIAVLDRYGYDSSAFRAGWLQSLDAATGWLDANRDEGIVNNLDPFTHRFFMRASQMYRAFELTGNTAYRTSALDFLSRGAAKQDFSDPAFQGMLPERGGFDLSYQSLALKYAAETYRMMADDTAADAVAARSTIRTVVDNSYALIDSRIAADGTPDLSDSTRIKENGRTGTGKKFDYVNAIRGYLTIASWHSDAGIAEDWHDLALRLYSFDATTPAT